MMREAKEALTVRFMDWMRDGADNDHYNVQLDYGMVMVSDWSVHSRFVELILIPFSCLA